MLIISSGVLAVIAGLLFYLRSRKEARELEIGRIQRNLTELSKLRSQEETGDLVPIPVRARRRRR